MRVTVLTILIVLLYLPTTVSSQEDGYYVDHLEFEGQKTRVILDRIKSPPPDLKNPELLSRKEKRAIASFQRKITAFEETLEETKEEATGKGEANPNQKLEERKEERKSLRERFLRGRRMEKNTR